MGCSASSEEGGGLPQKEDEGLPPKPAVKHPGISQSPINIDTEDPLVVYCDAYLLSHPLTLKNYRPGCARRIMNDGYTFKIQMHPEKEDDVSVLPGQINGKARMPKLSGGPLHGEYRLLQVQAHWGATDDTGSEHTVDGVVYQGEVHLMHMNIKYSSLEQAVTKRDGLAILGVFLQLSDDEAEVGHFNSITDKLENITYKGESLDLDGDFNPQCLIPEDYKKYWCYPGSLTTGDFQECVIWIVFKNTLKVSRQQLEALRSLRSYPRGKDPEIVKEPITERRRGACIIDNYRTLQPLHKRRIRASFTGNYSMYTY